MTSLFLFCEVILFFVSVSIVSVSTVKQRQKYLYFECLYLLIEDNFEQHEDIFVELYEK
jgi:hypothetical protein